MIASGIAALFAASSVAKAPLSPDESALAHFAVKYETKVPIVAANNQRRVMDTDTAPEVQIFIERRKWISSGAEPSISPIEPVSFCRRRIDRPLTADALRPNPGMTAPGEAGSQPIIFALSATPCVSARPYSPAATVRSKNRGARVRRLSVANASTAGVIMPDRKSIVVIGLGYVGLPLAVALAEKFDCIGLDIDAQRIAELQRFHDRTDEVSSDRLEKSSLRLTADPGACDPADFYIVTVPTPVDADNKPDLSIVMAATRTVGAMLDASRRPIVVYESTVYPGVTEEQCVPLLEQSSGLTCGSDFFVGYSPERINPGDREHTIDRITKVVSGQTPEICDKVADLYGQVTSGGVFKAASIKAAEAAKVIENAQRDINVAFMNEITKIFSLMDLSVWDVLDAAGTKWNFLPFTPGLVGGHCIGVDPFYLSYRAEQLGYDPKIILGGRETNDSMASWIADSIHARNGSKPSRALVMGLTFKENVPDLRNSKVADVVNRLAEVGHTVTVHDPHADAAEAKHEYGIVLDTNALERSYDIVVIAVPHRAYRELGIANVERLVAPGGVLADLKNCFGGAEMDQSVNRWTL